MSDLVILNTGDRIPWTGGSMLKAILDAGLQIQHYCGGQCACATCHVQIMRGLEHLAPIGDHEQDWLDLLDDATPLSRLACQCVRVQRGEVAVEVPPED